MSRFELFARDLAIALLASPWIHKRLVKRGIVACGPNRWMSPLIRRLLAHFSEAPKLHPLDELIAFLEEDRGFRRAWERWEEGGESRLISSKSPTMSPSAGAPSIWHVPPIPTTAALAGWLHLKGRELEWFSDYHGREAHVKSEALRHYRYHWLPKRAGKWRLLEAPKPRLKAIQRRLLHEILDHFPPHGAAHGFRQGRSIVSFASPHCGRRVVLRFDLKDFFPSIRSSRIHALFATAGYPPDVARRLTGLCTNIVPDEVLRQAPGAESPAASLDAHQIFRIRHLPQGAPTSPALANLAAYRLDCRLHGLAKSIGGNYTRYADDLAFSGDRELECCVRRFRALVYRIALEEGFEVQLRKSRVMRQGVRQQLVGIVVNAHLNRPRHEYDRLKAILHNCVKTGPQEQNRDGRPDFRAHLLGLISHWSMINPDRGQRLRAVFEMVAWPSEPQSSSES